MEACEKGLSNVVALLIEAGAEVNFQDKVKIEVCCNLMTSNFAYIIIKMYIFFAFKMGQAPIHRASRFAHFDTIDVLLDSGALIDIIDEVSDIRLYSYLGGGGYSFI